MKETKLQKAINLPRQNSTAAETSKQPYYEIFDKFWLIIFLRLLGTSKVYEYNVMSKLLAAYLSLDLEVRGWVSKCPRRHR